MDVRASSVNLNHLMTLATLAEAGSYTRAAEILNISQPSVSQQIRELERNCELPIIVQRGRSIALTPLGQELASAGARLAQERHKAEQVIARHRAGIDGYTTVGASMTTGTYILPKVLARFVREYPSVQVEISMGNTANVRDLVLNDVVELGLIEGPLQHDELTVRPLLNDQLFCYAAPSHPLIQRQNANYTIHDLVDETLLQREDGSGTREIIQRELHAAKARFRRILLLGATEAIKEGVKANLGIAWLPQISVTEEERSGRLCRLEIEGVHIQRDFSVIRRRDTSLTPSSQLFLDTLNNIATSV